MSEGEVEVHRNPDPDPSVDYYFEVGGIHVNFGILTDDVPRLLGWSTSEVILHLGSKGPELQAALRQVFGE